MRLQIGPKQLDIRWLIPLALAALIGLAACGDGDDQAEADATPNVAEEPAPEPLPVAEGPADPLPEAPAEPPAAERAPAVDEVVAEAEPPTPANEWDGELPPLAVDEISPDPELAAILAAADPDRGRSYAQRCIGCHSFAEEPPPDGPQAGPPLFGIVGARIGNAFAFDYSPVFVAMNDARAVWTEARLDAFLADPVAAAPGTRMNRSAIVDASDRADVIAYLMTLAADPTVIAGNEELLARIAAADPSIGEGIAGRCTGCHSFEPGGAALVGPNLYAVLGAPVGRDDSFAYSPALADLNDNGALWTASRLDAFLANPSVAVPGTRMGFGGIADADDRAALIAYLRTIADNVLPLATEQIGELIGIGTPQPGLQPLTFSVTQYLRGDRFFYTDGNCGECHGPSLRGGVSEHDDAPALVGVDFAARWFDDSVFALYDFIFDHTRTYIRTELVAYFVAFVLERNGFRPGNRALPLDRESLEAMGFYQ